MTMPSREFLVRQAVLNAAVKELNHATPRDMPVPEKLQVMSRLHWWVYGASWQDKVLDIPAYFVSAVGREYRALVAKHSAYVPVGDEELFASGRPIL
jgi:hypothetical protein